MSKLIKVTMNLTEQDVEDADTIQRHTAVRTKAQAVSFALSLTRFILDALRERESELLIRKKDGTIDRIVMPRLAPAAATASAS